MLQSKSFFILKIFMMIEKNVSCAMSCNLISVYLHKTFTHYFNLFFVFKVRTNAALALSCPGNFSSHILTKVWRAIMTAMETCDTQTDFSDYKQVAALKDQVGFIYPFLSSHVRAYLVT